MKFSGSTSSLRPQQGQKLTTIRDPILQEMYLLGPNTIWKEAEVIEKLSFHWLVPKQQATLEARNLLDQFGLDMCTQSEQVCTD